MSKSNDEPMGRFELPTSSLLMRDLLITNEVLCVGISSMTRERKCAKLRKNAF